MCRHQLLSPSSLSGVLLQWKLSEMANVRSSLPLRLRQLLAGEGAIVPSIKLDSEPPPKIKAFIDKVIQSPLQDIAIPLSGFRWAYNKGNSNYPFIASSLTRKLRVNKECQPFQMHLKVMMLLVAAM
ncbi:hypothetical protein SLA2020_192700 [Shorea laevis]